MESLLNWSKWQKKYSGLMRNLMFLISHFSGGNLALISVAKPNKSVKGTRCPLAVLKFRFYQGSVASLGFRQQRAPYRSVRHHLRHVWPRNGMHKPFVQTGGYNDD